MANTYSQLYVQLVFSVKGRQPIIPEVNRRRIEKYICGIVKYINCKPLSIYCNPDHVHLFISIPTSKCIADTTRDIKSFSSRFINEKCLTEEHFEWQKGYGAFSYRQSHVPAVCKYILNQEIHHRQISFEEEYIALLKAFNVPFDKKYAFD